MTTKHVVSEHDHDKKEKNYRLTGYNSPFFRINRKQTMMTEDFLHFIWKFRLHGQEFHTGTGGKLQIVNPGDHNHDAGPDFLNARVRLGATLWAGNVEIHVRSSDWIRHKHQHDEAYENIILHVVYDDDLPVKRKTGELIPTLVLRDLIHPDVYDKYNYFLNNHLWIPCAMRLPEARTMVINDWMTALSIARLERKSKDFG
ncbi:MAG: DUF2851 family protein, partial [Bacteroidales bacterium]|nr:DUF2851 family protein [Bacteroidales bacterium]